MDIKLDKLTENKNFGTRSFNNSKYIGELKKGKKEGKGVLLLNNGNRYEGDFKNNIRDGICYYASGNMYEGDYKNNKKEGKGVFYFSNGNMYEGDQKNDKREGKGAFYWNNGDR